MTWKSQIVCPKCKGTAALRINRNGFIQRRLLGMLGIYPWKCGACGADFLCRRRGDRPKTGVLDGDQASSTGSL